MPREHITSNPTMFLKTSVRHFTALSLAHPFLKVENLRINTESSMTGGDAGLGLPPAESMILLQSTVFINNVVYVACFPGKLLVHFVYQRILDGAACQNYGPGMTLWVALQTGHRVWDDLAAPLNVDTNIAASGNDRESVRMNLEYADYLQAFGLDGWWRASSANCEIPNFKQECVFLLWARFASYSK